MTNQGVKTAKKQNKKKQSHEYTLNKSKQPNLNEIFKTDRSFPWVTTESSCVVHINITSTLVHTTIKNVTTLYCIHMQTMEQLQLVNTCNVLMRLC